MAYDVNVTLDFVNTLLIHQTRRQKIIEGGLAPFLKELYWFARTMEKEERLAGVTAVTMKLLADYRMLTAKQKITYLREHIDTISLMEKRALLTEIHQALDLGEELISNG